MVNRSLETETVKGQISLNIQDRLDEDCNVQSDVGKKLTYKETIHTRTQTIRKNPTKKAKLLAYPDVQRWYKNVARGSPNTAEINLRRLGKFCEDHQILPMQLADLGMKDIREVTDLLQDHISWMESRGCAPQYIKGTITAVKSWLHHFDVFIKRKIKIANVDSTPTLEKEKVPEGQELAELFSRANLRAGAIMSLVGKAGLRPEVLGNHNATDGLMIKDLPDLIVKEGLSTFINKPPRIVVRKTLSKTNHEYYTFLTDLGAKRLLAYLNERLVLGEVLVPESPVIAPFAKYVRFRGENHGKRFVETITIRKDIQKAMRPRFLWRPYVLRAYFDTQLLIAESRGKIAHDFRVFFMGHKGSIEAKYTTNKGILPDALIKEMRNAYSRSEEFLDLEKGEVQSLEQKLEKEKTENLTAEERVLLQNLLKKLDNPKPVQETTTSA
ncbi:MAG TPA: site-specific integrase [Candidatus Nitrosotalea sp.]|nr:site-specific integrase [Candidatus Nitrosotalea sp.]